MTAVNTFKTLFLVVLVFTLMAPSWQQTANTFRLPYCEDIHNDKLVARNPLRLYLALFRNLFCLHENKPEGYSSKSKYNYLSDDEAQKKADELSGELKKPNEDDETPAKISKVKPGLKFNLTLKNNQVLEVPKTSLSSVKISLLPLDNPIFYTQLPLALTVENAENSLADPSSWLEPKLSIFNSSNQTNPFKTLSLKPEDTVYYLNNKELDSSTFVYKNTTSNVYSVAAGVNLRVKVNSEGEPESASLQVVVRQIEDKDKTQTVNNKVLFSYYVQQADGVVATVGTQGYKFGDPVLFGEVGRNSNGKVAFNGISVSLPVFALGVADNNGACVDENGFTSENQVVKFGINTIVSCSTNCQDYKNKEIFRVFNRDQQNTIVSTLGILNLKKSNDENSDLKQWLDFTVNKKPPTNEAEPCSGIQISIFFTRTGFVDNHRYRIIEVQTKYLEGENKDSSAVVPLSIEWVELPKKPSIYIPGIPRFSDKLSVPKEILYPFLVKRYRNSESHLTLGLLSGALAILLLAIQLLS